ncbi:GNAT family N-acetyltransferase [Lederbergia lenta]|uniref:N-acetyltransferase GCN5 n=1 Tax=Lederbergia lenta TaxID=1467 RepID=A0A2X4WAT2_LEDLE|nr:GNAT family N-acetyltransferase [Lederbergia lenta]MCM3109802.1 GNAT family N-acetyltransferase [Lederbergia lenta]MEC2324448.1 GNAT family N-acetyltransferase [Lederbergia lenta]SQI59829.1 N-acetyltransferase GCN5 [Lederbergia lenta]
MIIERVTSLDQYELNILIDDSLSEGYKFIKRLVDEYAAEYNKFDRHGEALYVAKIEDKVIGIGGLNIDPYLSFPYVGRVRHLYVLRQKRGTGVGKRLLNTIIDEARKHFRTLRLSSTNNLAAENLYIKCGFSKVEGIHKASHILEISKSH